MPSKKKIVLYAIIIVLIILMVLFFYRYGSKIKKILSPFFMAVFITYMVSPIVAKLEKKKIPKSKGILLVYSLIIATVISVVLFLIPELINNTRELMNTLPEIIKEYQRMLNNFLYAIRYSNWPDDIKGMVFNELLNGLDIVQKYVTETLRKTFTGFIGTINLVFDFTLAMVIAYYFIKDVDFFKNSALMLIPRKWRNGMINAGRDIHGILSNFIQGQLLTALIVGILETIGLVIVRVKYPLVLGLIGGAANIIPFFGPIIGAVPAVAVALLDSPVKALWTIGVFTLIQQIDNNFISPKIIEGRLGLHPVSTMLAVLVGGEFFGLIGMMLAVPVLAMIKAVLKRAIEAIV
ncbi:AI-2E family transporter [Pseudoclostridium thermosuccinogenes]|uniref:AI-2E family transporter n=1 Tax=Clostridium thermosuccinogenes TaxID=84032 RepID=UPI002FDB47AE